jgi:adenylate cyclase
MSADDLRAARILIVDDQEANIALLETFLADDGYAALHSTTDSREAVALFQEHRPDLVLLDLHMPHLDGFGVIEQLQPLISADEYLPILVLTADATTETKRRALAGGAKDFLAKPLDEVEVLLRIRNLLETRRLHQQLLERHRALAQEREVSERLLLNVLPKPVADRLRQSDAIIADSFADATVVFADIVDFTSTSAQLAPEQVVTWLNGIFTEFDQLAERCGLEKIKTIGDAYMAVAGLHTPDARHAAAALEFALALREALPRHPSPNGAPLRMRIGAHSGPVVAGIIGRHKFIYDLWGDTVNTASRMLTSAEPGDIHVSDEVRQRVAERFALTARGPREISGKGIMHTHLVVGFV